MLRMFNTVCDTSAVSILFITKFIRQKQLPEHDAREVVQPTQALKERVFFVWQFTVTDMVCLSFSIIRFSAWKHYVSEACCFLSILFPVVVRSGWCNGKEA